MPDSTPLPSDQADADEPGIASVSVSIDGPYELHGDVSMTDWLGRTITPPDHRRLCRCGGSSDKPWCDDTHLSNGFSGAKHPDRVPDRLDAYEARQFEIRDNRGLCAHSGRCTDALATAFRLGEEPFVAPSGARADDILRAVQACPSGALSVAIEGARADQLVDTHRPASVEVSLDGPYRFTGGTRLTDDTGADWPEWPAGASREHVSLCRCGRSSNKPFCSGAHWHADFRDPVTDPTAEPTLFEWAGGYPALLRVTTIFYERHVPQDDLLSPLFARGWSPTTPSASPAWLSEVFGGPAIYSQRYGGYAWMISQHLGKHLTEQQRSRWVALLTKSAEEARLPNDAEFRAAFTAYLEWGSHIAVENSSEGAQPPAGMPMPRWHWVCDATPGARRSSLPSSEPEAGGLVAEAPVDGETVTFDRHIRGLFRPNDRASMRSSFDLWDRDTVSTHAELILARLQDGSMPCDGPWPADQIDRFRQWIESGCS